MDSTAMTMAILTHPYHLMLAAVVLFHAGQHLFVAEERKPEVERQQLYSR